MTERRAQLDVEQVLAAVPTRAGVESGLVVLREPQPPRRALSFYIAQPEARAIQTGLRGELAPRPSTWDLFLSLMAALGGSLSAAVIDGVEEGRHFFATLEVQQGERRHLVSCRPSDAIALVVRVAGASLYATEQVLALAGALPEAPPAQSSAEEARPDSPAPAQSSAEEATPAQPPAAPDSEAGP